MQIPWLDPFLPALLVIGRILLGSFCLIAGVHHFFTLAPITEAMRARGVPAPRLVLIAGSLLQIVAGGLLMVGLFVAPAALSLVIFTLLASWMLLDFWNQEGERRSSSISVWRSNLAIVGGLLIAAAADQPSAAVVPMLAADSAHCASVELTAADKALTAKPQVVRQTRANFAEAYSKACSEGLLKEPLVIVKGANSGRLFLLNAPEANIASIYAHEGRMLLEYPFVTADGSVNVPTAEEIEEAIYCAVHGATEQEQAESGRCLPD